MAIMTELVETEPLAFEEEIEQLVLVDVMVEEYKSIMKNSVLEVVQRPIDKLVVGSRWIFKLKHTTNGSIDKYKAILVAKGFSKVEGIDYEETFSLVARYSSIRSILALDMQMGWKIH